MADAEKLRTEWATGRQTTAAYARNLDQRQETASMFDRLCEKLGLNDAPVEGASHVN